jgi:predicted DCC family thiol-disulfide oxidoreductase YuxK
MPRAVLLYDGACAFCRKSAARLARRCGEAIELRALQDALRDDPRLAAAEIEQGVRLVESDGRMHVGAGAILRALELAGRWRAAAALYRRAGWFRALAEALYRFVARRRRRECDESCTTATPPQGSSAARRD